MINWLQNHLLPCPFKYFTGIDCPGCGFQRAVIELVQGNLHKSFAIYPPAVPLIAFFIYLSTRHLFKSNLHGKQLKTMLFIVVTLMVLVNYGFKVWGLLYTS